MRSKILAPLAASALALTAASSASAQQPPPSAPPPAYGQPAYGQPAYGQPAYGQPAQPAAEGSASASVSTSNVSSDGDYKQILPWVFGGLGAAQIITGIVLVAAAPSMPDNCTEGTRTCTRKVGQSEADFGEDQEQAGQAQQMPALGGIAIASGTLFLVTGIAMYYWYKPKEKGAASTPMVTPYAGPNGGGLAAIARF